MKAFPSAILTLFVITISFSQNRTHCNPKTLIQSDEKLIPKEVCIPENCIINQIYTKDEHIDIDGDLHEDFIFTWQKSALTEGDTLHISAYRMNSDSTYSLLKSFSNIFPIYLESYDHAPKDPALRKIYACYVDNYPLKELTISKGVISIELYLDAASGIVLKYKYDPRRNNWMLTSSISWIGLNSSDREYTNNKLPLVSESIDDFSYQKYLCPELFEE